MDKTIIVVLDSLEVISLTLDQSITSTKLLQSNVKSSKSV